jgi:hydroxymethylglutaryl-CoA lyase
MAGTKEVISKLWPGRAGADCNYTVLVPNQKGLDVLNDVLDSHSSDSGIPPLVQEIAVFTGATDAFTKANVNMSIEASLDRLSVLSFYFVCISC